MTGDSSVQGYDFPEPEGEGEMVHLEIDGEIQSFELEEGVSEQEREEFINSMIGIEPGEPPEIDHPDLELADLPASELPEPGNPRLLCRVDSCKETEVFPSFDEVRESGWTEVVMPVGFLTDLTELHYAFCPNHSLTEREGYDPGKDFASPEWEGVIDN